MRQKIPEKILTVRAYQTGFQGCELSKKYNLNIILGEAGSSASRLIFFNSYQQIGLFLIPFLIFCFHCPVLKVTLD